ncbi:uncharacterized protein LOC104859472 isoform X3 [Fukomys damarensis]|uniref:uncharacterized protein LOC104859472 isoform X3 n=1 Tax=Fukomys damarensis TaxID=885580 RepID=UPI00053F9DEF|nr:uncharacterized protein LOC104859472 isoform X3 [Fukomys damarensis]
MAGAQEHVTLRPASPGGWRSGLLHHTGGSLNGCLPARALSRITTACARWLWLRPKGLHSGWGATPACWVRNPHLLMQDEDPSLGSSWWLGIAVQAWCIPSLCRELRPNLLSAHGAVEKGKQAQIPGSPGISSKFQVSSLKATDSRAGSTWARACVDQGTRGQEEPGSQENPVPTCWDLATWVRGELTGSPEHLYPALGRV